MELITTTIVVLLVAGALALALYPLWQQSQQQTTAMFIAPPPGQTYGEVEARYQATLASIKDLMFDYEMGKISHEDYNLLLVNSKADAAKIRQQLDRMSQNHAIDPALDTEIETLVAQIRQTPLTQNGNGKLVNKIDQEIAQLKTSNGHCTTCHHCNGRVKVGDTFCPSCGHTLRNGNGAAAPTAQQACTACGSAIQPTDAFCAGCGTALDPLQNAPHFEKAPVI